MIEFNPPTGNEWIEIVSVEEMANRMFIIHEGEEEEEEKTEE